jgi:hypothetical protein
VGHPPAAKLLETEIKPFERRDFRADEMMQYPFLYLPEIAEQLGYGNGYLGSTLSAVEGPKVNLRFRGGTLRELLDTLLLQTVDQKNPIG